MNTIINEIPCYVSNYNKNKCCARLKTNLSIQCKNNPKIDGLCMMHYKMGSNNIKTVFDDISGKSFKNYHRDICTHKSNDSIIKIQKIARKFIVKTIIHNRGIACYCRHLLNNNTDCSTLSDISEVSKYEFISYKDENNKLWGFHIATLKELINKDFKNPYNTFEFSQSFKERFKTFVSKFEKINKNVIEIKQEIITDPKIKLQHKCLKVFQIMDELNQYTQCNWFTDLNLQQLKHLYKQIEDIWNYRVNLSEIDKLKYTNNGKLFIIPVNTIYKMTSKLKLSNILLDNFYRLVTEGKTSDDRTTGALWILSALTIVSTDARNAMPWLFQSANVY